MFEPGGELPNGVLALRASGTVIAQDVPEAVALLAGTRPELKERGLVVFVGPDFDGYLAELVRGLEEEAAKGNAPFARWALVVEDDKMGEVHQFGRFAAEGNFRVFQESVRQSALEWAAG